MIDFLKFKKIYFAFSALFLIPGLLFLLLYGLKPSIDFTGGAIFEVGLPSEVETSPEKLEEILIDFPVQSVQDSGENTFLIRLSPVSDDERVQMGQQISTQIGEFQEIRFETVGPSLAKELIYKTLVAISIATVFIVLYIASRFKDLDYGLAAVLAMFHDTLILLGFFAFFGHFLGVEVDALFVAAVLTVLSFSLHDTIVVFDRIRETLRNNSGVSFEYVSNKAVTETLVRSLNNSLTIAFMLLSLALLGGETIRYFVVALLIGTVAGTYSSTFTAVPILHLLHSRKNK